MALLVKTIVPALALVVLTARGIEAQNPQAKEPDPKTPAKETPAKSAVEVPKVQAPTVRIQLVLARYKAEKRVASEPYLMMMVANGEPKVLRTGAEVPIVDPVSPASPTGATPASYKSIGTDIVCDVRLSPDGRLALNLSVNSSSVYPEEQKPATRPAFRNYRLGGGGVLRDGQTVEVASATDSLTGEVIKAEVTINIMK